MVRFWQCLGIGVCELFSEHSQRGLGASVGWMSRIVYDMQYDSIGGSKVAVLRQDNVWSPWPSQHIDLVVLWP